MFCKNCGKEIDNNAYICPNCGVKVHDEEAERREQNAQADSGSKVGWGILSFFIPLVGLILFIVWRNDRPQTAKVCGICALVSFGLSILSSILFTAVLAPIFAGLLADEMAAPILALL